MPIKERLYLLSERISGAFRPYQNRDVTMYEVGEEVTLYDPQTEQVHILNAAAAAIWNLCNGNRNAGDIIGQVANSYNLEPDVVAQDVMETLEQFQQTRLVLV